MKLVKVIPYPWYDDYDLIYTEDYYDFARCGWIKYEDRLYYFDTIEDDSIETDVYPDVYMYLYEMSITDFIKKLITYAKWEFYHKPKLHIKYYMRKNKCRVK